MQRYILLPLIVITVFNCMTQDFNPIKKDVSLYKQFFKHCLSQRDTELRLDAQENEFFQYVGPILKQYPAGRKMYLDTEGFFTSLFANNPDTFMAPELVKQYKKSPEATKKWGNSPRYIDYYVFASVYCKFIETSERSTIIGRLRNYAFEITYLQVMRSIFRDLSKKESIDNIKEIKKICATRQLLFFGYDLPGMADHKNITETYRSMKNYKDWYASSWVASIFWFMYKKPDMEQFNILKMKYRYIKYADNQIR